MNTTLNNLIKDRPCSLFKAKDFDQNYLRDIFDRENSQRSEYDLYTPIKMGKEWLFELTEKYQPKTAFALLQSGEFGVFGRKNQNYDYFNPILALEVCGRMIQVFRFFNARNPSDENYKGAIDDRMDCLPEELCAAFYNRFIGLSVINPENIGQGSNLLPKAIGDWTTIDTYLGALRKKTQFLPFIEDVIPDVKPDYKSDLYHNFSCFMSWGTGKDMDMFFVKTHIKDGVIYYIRNHDVKNMGVIDDPVEAIDLYCEHILLRKNGRFDFRPYVKKLK